MRMLSIFGEAFLDGFTMAGIRRLRSPASPDWLFAPEDDELDDQVVAFKFQDQDRVQVRGDLHQVPLSALDEILRAVTAERNSRVPGEPVIGASK